ncbi:hypothetical protein AQJ30_13685 [Streptomyces longwoodensis]|uniref:Uncharacterized protein n=1 Tax=Streptomyces longwoodensis TaxID=68231 RepID=A0A117QNT9_9ACTN|nr:hypothetical protein AQJ30_13685 [Streptomyces longwoodensis]
MSRAARYSSPDSLLRPWQEKCSTSVSSRRRSVKKPSMRRRITWDGSSATTSTSKSPIWGSPSTCASAEASEAGEASSFRPGSS